MKFKEWFKYKLHVNRFPLPSEIAKSKYNYIINVSDEFIPDCYDISIKNGIKYFWFPMSERVGQMGLNSIYGALQILFIAEKENANVLLHCHAGANRSPTVQEAYYFLRTKTHFQEIKVDEEIEERLNEFLGVRNSTNNRLIENINSGNLPSIKQMEGFLINSEIQFNKDVSMRGGGIDSSKYKASLFL